MDTNCIQTLAQQYHYEPWRVRIMDVQRRGIAFPGQHESLPHLATLVLQANHFTFTTSETTSVGEIATPYTLTNSTHLEECYNITYNEAACAEFSQVRLVEVMGKPSDYYFAFKNKDGGSMYQYLVLNPYENCAFRCKYCSRLPYFAGASYDYRSSFLNLLERVRNEVQDTRQVSFINIITGSQPTADADIQMFQEIIGAVKQQGFQHCEFGVYSPHIFSREQLEFLRSLGVIFLTVTVETTTNHSRSLLHGVKNPKSQPFANVLTLLSNAAAVMPYVTTTVMLGYDSLRELQENLTLIAQQTHGTVNHYIPRIWSKRQLQLLHSDAQSLEYYVALCALIEQQVNIGKTTAAKFFEERFGIRPHTLRYRS